MKPEKNARKLKTSADHFAFFEKENNFTEQISEWNINQENDDLLLPLYRVIGQKRNYSYCIVFSHSPSDPSALASDLMHIAISFIVIYPLSMFDSIH